jgi:hypothetical protein
VHPIIARTFGGLSRQYYFRNFVFGLIYPALFWFMASHANKSIPIMSAIVTVIFLAINTLLYPYSRFVYESIVDFIMGRNVFFVNAFVMLFVKWVTMTLCWTFAIFIAPIGLAYLYFAHGRSGAAA